jgi:hypothetical protein
MRRRARRGGVAGLRWWAKNTDLDLWLTLTLLPVALVAALAWIYWR